MSSEIEKVELDEIIESEESIDHNKPEEFQIKYWSYNRSITELVDMYHSKEIIIPSLQREYVWSYEQASLFIDSIIRGLPIPSFFVTEIAGKYLIIDGLQRLHTIYMFINGITFDKWKGVGKTFYLSKKPSITSSCRGKSFDELNEDYQKKIKRSMMNIIEFSQISPSKNYSAMYQIFERINSTGRVLEAQEVRNAAYHSEFNGELNELGNYELFVNLFNCTKTTARTEMALRCLSIYVIYELSNKYEMKKSYNLKNLLNEFMAYYQAKEMKLDITSENFPYFYNNDLEYLEIIEKFKWAIGIINDKIGPNAFHNIKTKDPIEYKNTLHATLTEALVVSFMNMFEKNIKEDAREKIDQILITDDFQKIITEGTMSLENIKKRINTFCMGLLQ